MIKIYFKCQGPRYRDEKTCFGNTDLAKGKKVLMDRTRSIGLGLLESNQNPEGEQSGVGV